VKARAYWLASLIFVVVALCARVTALHEASKGMNTLARAIVAPDDQKDLMKTEARQSAGRSDLLEMVGLALAVVSLVCLVVSFKRHEPVLRSVPIALLACYLLLQLLIV
jgi:hypothetical protein